MVTPETVRLVVLCTVCNDRVTLHLDMPLFGQVTPDDTCEAHVDIASHQWADHLAKHSEGQQRKAYAMYVRNKINDFRARAAHEARLRALRQEK